MGRYGLGELARRGRGNAGAMRRFILIGLPFAWLLALFLIPFYGGVQDIA